MDGTHLRQAARMSRCRDDEAYEVRHGVSRGGRADAGRSVALALQAAQEAARCGLPLSRPSGREPHFQAGNWSAAISGYYKNMGTMAPPSCAMVPPPEHARDARGSSTWVWHACECHHVGRLSVHDSCRTFEVRCTQ